MLHHRTNDYSDKCFDKRQPHKHRAKLRPNVFELLQEAPRVAIPVESGYFVLLGTLITASSRAFLRLLAANPSGNIVWTVCGTDCKNRLEPVPSSQERIWNAISKTKSPPPQAGRCCPFAYLGDCSCLPSRQPKGFWVKWKKKKKKKTRHWSFLQTTTMRPPLVLPNQPTRVCVRDNS